MTADTFSHADALTLLVTAETLLLTAFSVIVLIATPGPGGHNMNRSTAWAVAILVGVVLTLVAIGSILAWWQVFVADWPSSAASKAEALAALAGIAVQPIIALVLCVATKP